MDEKRHKANKSAPSPTSEMLTLSEQESLRQDKKDANAYYQKVFRQLQSHGPGNVSGNGESAIASTQPESK